jgi:hypothetical protein
MVVVAAFAIGVAAAVVVTFAIGVAVTAAIIAAPTSVAVISRRAPIPRPPVVVPSKRIPVTVYPDVPFSGAGRLFVIGWRRRDGRIYRSVPANPDSNGKVSLGEQRAAAEEE